MGSNPTPRTTSATHRSEPRHIQEIEPKALSAIGSAHPNRTGIGRILIYRPRDLFKPKKVLRRVLAEYLRDLKKVTDIGIVMTMNLLMENLEQFPQTRDQVGSFQQRFRDLGLKHASARLSNLLHVHHR